MKNIGLKILLVAILALSQPVLAKSVPVKALNDFSTVNPPKVMNFEILQDTVLNDATVLKKDYKVEAKVIQIKLPTRLKRDANFKLAPEYYIDLSGEKHNFENNFTASYTTVLDKKQLAKSAALSVGSHFVKGISTGVNAIEGAVENQEGNRVKSAVKSAYESSPLSYVEKGHDIVIKTGDCFLLKFKLLDDDSSDEEI